MAEPVSAQERLDKIVVADRRQLMVAEVLLVQGMLRVDGMPVLQSGAKAQPRGRAHQTVAREDEGLVGLIRQRRPTRSICSKPVEPRPGVSPCPKPARKFTTGVCVAELANTLSVLAACERLAALCSGEKRKSLRDGLGDGKLRRDDRVRRVSSGLRVRASRNGRALLPHLTGAARATASRSASRSCTPRVRIPISSF